MATFQPVPQWALPFVGNEEKLAELGLKFNPVWLKWFIDTLGEITGSIIEHNNLGGLQGGDGVNEFYHLNAPGAAGTFAQSDGTNWINSAYTLPTAAPAAGRILRSDGTNVVASTPTFPNTAASGSFMRGDGTNWTQSTLTIPDTLAANRVPYATAANTLGSSANLTFDGTALALANVAQSALTITGSNSSLIRPFVYNTFNGVGSGSVSFLLRADDGDSNVFFDLMQENGSGRWAFGVSADQTVRLATNSGGSGIPLNAGNDKLVITSNGRMFVGGGTTPTAVLHLPAGTATASTAPLKFTDGVYLTTPEAGTVEWDDDTHENLTFTPVSTRYLIPLIDSGVGNLTSGRMPFTTTGGRFTDESGFEYNTSTNTLKVAELQFGTHSAIGAETVTGYIPITDTLGNARKLAVVS